MSEETKPLRVLVADDHAPTRDDVRRALDADGRFNICSEVADAAEAVQAALRKQPDICLLDVRMPGSGLAAAWEIAARLPRVKIVMLTVSDEDTDLLPDPDARSVVEEIMEMHVRPFFATPPARPHKSIFTG